MGAAVQLPDARRNAASQTAGRRVRLTLDDGWRFYPDDVKGGEGVGLDDSRWTPVKLPHTWNADDAFDDTPGYRRGVGWYRKRLSLDASLAGKRLFLYFEGANQVADVYINGKLAGEHKGGYTAFAFDITSLVKWGEEAAANLVAVRVDNSVSPDIPPAPTADFNSYGGIYRDVRLLATEPVHITTTDYGSQGVYVDTPGVSAESATIRVRGAVANDAAQACECRVVNTVVSAEGRTVAILESAVNVAAGSEGDFEQTSGPISRPGLWSPDTPYLYTVRTQVYDGARLRDETESHVGFRWFSFNPDRGFFLNGKPFKLRGVNRHQDYAGLGNAVPAELQVKDLELIKRAGLNSVLLAHYPHAPAVLDAADRLGLVVWEEAPIVREISTSAEFARNCQAMLTEMIRQHYNHPSIVMWCYMNEIFLRPRNEEGYVRKTVQLARTLDQLVRRLDPTRYTVISVNRPYDQSDIYNASGLLDIPQVVGWHMYFGWYYGEFAGLGGFLDEQHRRYPKRILFVSEYGADYDPRLHSLNPRFGDSTTEWAQSYHESYVLQLEARPYLGGSAVWAGFDFGSEERGNSMPHMNTKGLFTFKREPKDIYYLYSAHFSDKPVLHIATRDWPHRTGTTTGATQDDAQQAAGQPVKVYTNLPEVELFLNGRSLGVRSVGVERLAVWEVSFRDEVNRLEARGRSGPQTYTDHAAVSFSYRPSNLAAPSFRFKSLAVNVGSGAQFTDGAGTVWEADQPYQPGGWGYTGGVPGNTNQSILKSPDDPLYQTVRQGLTAYRFDVPEGNYAVELLFTEHQHQRPGERVFSVAVNGRTVVENLDLVRDAGALVATKKELRVRAARRQGINVEFTPVVGQTVVSGIRIRKL